MPLEEVLAFSPAQIRGCFLALGYCWRGLVFHHSFIKGNLAFLLGQKHSHRQGRGGTACFSLPINAEQTLCQPKALFPPALVCGSWAWPRCPHTLLCHSAGTTLSNTPPQLEQLWISNLLTVPSTLETEVLVLLSELPLM